MKAGTQIEGEDFLTFTPPFSLSSLMTADSCLKTPKYPHAISKSASAPSCLFKFSGVAVVGFAARINAVCRDIFRSGDADFYHPAAEFGCET